MNRLNNKRGLVNDTSYVVIPQEKVAELLAQEGSYDPSDTSQSLKAALLVKLVESDVTLNAGDIQIGAVEMKDGVTDLRANIEQDDTKNAFYVMSESMAQEVTLAAVLAKLSADPATQTTLADILTKLNDSMNVTVINQLLEVTNLDGATEIGKGTTIDVSNYNILTIHIKVVSINTNVVVNVQSSLNGSDWVTINSSTITSNGMTEVQLSNVKYKYLRTTFESESGGTEAVVTTTIFGGN
jgi:hypothetical protein